MKKLVVFDWNGTLFSDTQSCFEASNEVIKSFGGKPISIKTFRDTLVIPSFDYYCQHGCNKQDIQANPKKLVETFINYYEARASKCRTRQGARELLEWLLNNSFRSIILSQHNVAAISNQLKRLGLDSLISEILANNPHEHSPISHIPKKQRMEEYLKIHKYDPKDIYLVGDSPEEIKVGKELGATSIAILYGCYSESRLKKVKPDYFIKSLTELRGILKSNSI